MDSFTEYINNKILDDVPDYFYDENYDPEIDFIKTELRKFGDGLTQLMEKCGYTGPNTIPEKIEYLDKALKNIGVDFAKATLKAWFENGQHPKSQSRKKMFQICFALNASLEDTKWFFNHVYYDRCFDFHQYTETVFFYCLKNGRNYSYASELLAKTEKIISGSNETGKSNCLTGYLYSNVGAITEEEDFLKFISEHKNDFGQKNTTAAKRIEHIINELSVPNNDRIAAGFIKKDGKVPDDILKSCGILMQWLYRKYSHEELIDILGSSNVASNDFILSSLMNTYEGIENNSSVPDLIKINFPSKKTLSDVISSKGSKGSYDAVRKILIAFEFMLFWCQAEIRDDLDCPAEMLPEVFFDDMSASLINCGYSELFPGNPYDWLFMRASRSEDPIGFIQGFINIDVE